METDEKLFISVECVSSQVGLLLKAFDDTTMQIHAAALVN
jgi:hypothetical protein